MDKEQEKQLESCIESIDKVNTRDERKEIVNGVELPYELLYSQRMTATLQEFLPNHDPLIAIACRGHHIARWTIPRNLYPMDRPGYMKWRTMLKVFHGDEVVKIMQQNGYQQDDCERVRNMILKKNLKKNEEAQVLEDVICLTFLSYYFLPFAAKHNEEKVVDIVKKTWAKMSTKAQEAALKLPLEEEAVSLVEKALS